MTIQLVDRSIGYPVGILEDAQVQVEKFIISCDFMVMDMDESSQLPIILGKSATTGVVIDVPAGKISFQLCEEKVDFCFPTPTTPSLTTPSVLVVRTVSAAISETEVFEGDGHPT